MRESLRTRAVLLVTVPILAGCGAAQASPGAPTPAPAAQAASPGAAGATKSIADLTKSSRAIEGFFTIYQDTVTGAAHLEVSADQLDREFIYFTHVVDGVVAAGHFRGAFGDNKVVTVRKHFNRIEFVTENAAFWFDPQSPLSRAAAANISPAVLASQEIIAQEDGRYLIKADDLFLTEAFAQVKPSPNPNARPGTAFNLGNLSRAKTRYVDIRNYPLNTEIVVEYVYENPAPTVGGGTEVTDARNVSVRTQHSLIAMPENGYRPRFDDPRVGYFTNEQTDMVSASPAPYRDLINRWNLVKRQPGTALSEPVEPIVWWIENTTPHELRPAIRDAVLAWNTAFEAAGFRNAMVVNVQPDDADWDAGDIRYNVLRWTSSPTPPFGGYGPSFSNPRTGQIIGADIMLEWVAITNRLRAQELFSTAGIDLAAFEPAGADPRLCDVGAFMQQQMLFGAIALLANGADEIEMKEYTRQYVYYLVLHEVGHTLGLNHNMKASQMHSLAALQDGELTARVGLYGSVMDYPAAVVAAPGARQGQYYITRPGPYDLWAIEFGYSEALADPAAEAARLDALLARSTDPALAFGNDADDMRAPGKALDPRINTGDMSSDAIGFAIGQFELIDELLPRLRERYSREGESYHALRNAYLVLTGSGAGAASNVSRYIGGVYVERAMAGQPGATQPFTPVPRAEQKRAMGALAEHVFAPDAFAGEQDLYAWLQMQRRGFGFFAAPEDPKIHDRVLNIHRSVLAHLLHPVVLTRIGDTGLYGNEYGLAEMVGDLTTAIFQADARGNVNGFRRNLQSEYVTRLAGIMDPEAGGFGHDARAVAFQNLRTIRGMIAGRSANAETTAHRQYLVHLIDRALAID